MPKTTINSFISPRLAVLVIATMVAITLAACASSPGRPPPSKPGGYYLDDGPDPNPPDNLDAIPDAVPKIEPVNRFASRPYSVLGRSYRPYTELTPYKARGVASWYGKRYHGQKTSSGEPYDMYAMTAAHTVLPVPSYARVTNLANGKSVVVRINDRGPFHEDRLIDLSYVAAQHLGLLGRGSGLVEVEAIVPEAAPPASESVAAVREPLPSAPEPTPPAPEPVPAPSPASAPVSTEQGGIYVQLGAFASPENADGFLRRMRLDLGWLADSMNVYRKDNLFRVRAGPYANREAASRDAQRVQKELGFKALVLER
jgi:rare lipoprotein A